MVWGRKSASRKCRRDRNGKKVPEPCHYVKGCGHPKSGRKALTTEEVGTAKKKMPRFPCL